jgi:tetraacyldisaccharide 4'-kinase
MIGTLWSRVRNHLYDKGVISATRPNEFVISVGNITWGGTGKTAFTEYLAKLLITKGYKIAIVSRGFGRQSEGIVVVSDGKKILEPWTRAGDEPYWLASRIPEAVVIVAESRTDALDLVSKFEVDLILLDDAFQHRRIARDIDLVLVDATENLTALHVIPFGKLREPIDSLHRASAIILTHSRNTHEETSSLINKISTPIFHANYYPIDFEFGNKKIAAFCGLASPEHFQNFLKEQVAELVFFRKFPDHHIYTSSELNELQEEAVRAGAEALVTTGKDAVKLNPNDFRLPFGLIHAELRVEEEEKFQSWIFQSLDSRVPVGPMKKSYE